MTTLRKALNRIWASSPTSGNIALTDAKWSQGWVAEIPAYQHLNWLHNVMDTNQLALAERGVFEYGNDVTYAKGALAWREADGFIYVALVANPTTAPPSLQWERSCVQLSRTDFEILMANWQSHIENVSNPHNVTAIQAGAVPVTGGTYTGRVLHTSIKFGGLAGKSLLTEDADGSNWIYDGVKVFNISPTGIPRTFFSGQWWNFLYKENYVAARTAVEGLFSVPPADVDIPLTAHMYPKDSGDTVYPDYTRAGTLSYTNKLGQSVVAPANTPAFGRKGLVLSGKDTRLVGLQLPTDKVFTLCFTTHRMFGATLSISTPFSSVGNLSIKFELGRIKLLFNGVVKIDVADTATVNTISIRSTATSVDLFVNGALAGTTSPLGTIDAVVETTLGAVGDTATNAELTNFKFWYHTLTNEQISGL